MTYEETFTINHGFPPIDLINKSIREEDGISCFYKFNLKKDKRPYWKGKILNSSKTRKKLIELGIKLYGENFKPDEMGLTDVEKLFCNSENERLWIPNVFKTVSPLRKDLLDIETTEITKYF